MKDIDLKKIDESNFIACFNLKLAAGQEKYVSHPVRSLAQAYVYYDQCTPFGIYAGETMVGYVMAIYDRDEAAYNIWHMMIDRDFQGKGYGQAALQRVLEYISEKPFGESDTVLLTCNPENEVAYRLYRRLGFSETGRSDGEESELGVRL
ncbi:MAG: GNAT family N-acetyltransferase [Oscillospiraceae bacterium]|nr:GNAT family N-acetyltransferase [Oscillospiraceae bacterium]